MVQSNPKRASGIYNGPFGLELPCESGSRRRARIGLGHASTPHPSHVGRATLATTDYPTPQRESTPVGERGTYRSGFAFGTLSFFAVAGVGVVSTIITARLYGVRIIGQ